MIELISLPSHVTESPGVDTVAESSCLLLGRRGVYDHNVLREPRALWPEGDSWSRSLGSSGPCVGARSGDTGRLRRRSRESVPTRLQDKEIAGDPARSSPIRPEGA